MNNKVILKNKLTGEIIFEQENYITEFYYGLVLDNLCGDSSEVASIQNLFNEQNKEYTSGSNQSGKSGIAYDETDSLGTTYISSFSTITSKEDITDAGSGIYGIKFTGEFVSERGDPFYLGGLKLGYNFGSGGEVFERILAVIEKEQGTSNEPVEIIPNQFYEVQWTITFSG